MSTPLEEMKLLCVYIIAVAESGMPAQLKWELIFRDDTAYKLQDELSLFELYDFEGHEDWVGYDQEVQEFASVVERLLDDLEKVDTIVWP